MRSGRRVSRWERAVCCLALAGCGAATAQRPVVTVAASGGQFPTVQAAVDAAPVQGEVIRIAPGTYREKLHIAGNGIELRGTGARPEEVVLTWDDSAGSAGGTNRSGSVTVTGDDFVAENLTIQNDWERTHERSQEGAQAVALMITGDREVLRHVRLLGYQDTLYANSKTCHNSGDPQDRTCRASRQLFADCYIEGHVDFIFGDAKAAFERCTIHAVAHPVVTITAQSRLYPLEDSGYLFRDCTITAAPGIRQLLLGRPWRAYSTVIWVDTTVQGTRLAPQGWAEWGGRLATSHYAEFGTRTDGVADDLHGRVAGTLTLTAAEARRLTMKTWLAGADGWNPEAVR